MALQVSQAVLYFFLFTLDNILLLLAIGHCSYFQIYNATSKIKTQVTESTKLQT